MSDSPRHRLLLSHQSIDGRPKTPDKYVSTNPLDRVSKSPMGERKKLLWTPATVEKLRTPVAGRRGGTMNPVVALSQRKLLLKNGHKSDSVS